MIFTGFKYLKNILVNFETNPRLVTISASIFEIKLNIFWILSHRIYIFLDNEKKLLLGDLTNILAKKEHWWRYLNDVRAILHAPENCQGVAELLSHLCLDTRRLQELVVCCLVELFVAGRKPQLERLLHVAICRHSQWQKLLKVVSGTVLLFSKLNTTFFGYFDPENILWYNENK